MTSQYDGWETPRWLFDKLNAEFGFTLDPCCTHENALCAKHYTKEEDGLAQDWTGETVFCNPPYGAEMPKWIEKCATERATCVMLIPARTDTKAFHRYIFHNPNVRLRFIEGRLKFARSRMSAPFPSVVVIFKNKEDV